MLRKLLLAPLVGTAGPHYHRTPCHSALNIRPDGMHFYPKPMLVTLPAWEKSRPGPFIRPILILDPPTTAPLRHLRGSSSPLTAAHVLQAIMLGDIQQVNPGGVSIQI